MPQKRGALANSVELSKETDSPAEGDGFELSVPANGSPFYRVNPLGCLREIGVGADVSVQPGFVIIMPSLGCSALLFSRGP